MRASRRWLSACERCCGTGPRSDAVSYTHLIDLDWWVYAHHRAETEFSWACAGLNAFYLLLGIIGLRMRPRFWGALLAYLLLRSALLWTVQAPETRYTLECLSLIHI